MFFKSDSPSQRAWYFYDWANSAYITTTTTVFFGPYLTSIAESAAGCTGDVCDASLAVGPLSIAPGSLFFYVITLTTLVSAFLLPLVGAYADLRHDKQKLMAHFAWVGAIAASLMFFVSGTSWLLGSLLLIIGIATSVFTAVTLTRMWVAGWLRRARPSELVL